MLLHQLPGHLFFAATLAVSTLASCQKSTDSQVIVPPVAQLPSVPPLKDVAPFPVGVSVGYSLLSGNPTYQNVVKGEMGSLTVENAQKWGQIHPAKDRFDFTQADFIVDWATTNGKRVHGHNLLWHAYNPGWVGTFQGDSAAWETLMKTHIETVVAHFKGKVASWDVVNEAFTDIGSLRNADPNGSIWRQKLGPDYIARAFRYAHAVDPTALLFYNEYGQEGNPGKIAATLAMVADFKKRNIPIHGLGIQMHIGVSQGNAGIQSVIEQFAATGLQVHISELDILVSDWQKNPNLQYTDALQAKQGDKYNYIAATYRTLVPKAQQYGITNWNVGDADSWITQSGYTDWPLLFDQSYTRKKVFYRYVEGMK